MNKGLLPHLEVFLAVARARSFSRAARDLGVSTSAVSQSVRNLEAHLRVVLLTRTTRSVALTDAGLRLVETAEPAVRQALSALTEVSAAPGETVGRVRLSLPHVAWPEVIVPVVPKFRERHPRIDVDLVVDDRMVDIVSEGYDAGIRLNESIERDMVRIRLTDAFRFVVVGSPAYLAKRGTPERPEDLLRHDCITFRSATTGSLYAWELERGRRNWRIPVRGGVVANHNAVRLALAEEGVGLAYISETSAADAIRADRVRVVLDAFAAPVPGFFLYYPSRSQVSPALRAFVEAAKEWSARNRKSERGTTRSKPVRAKPR
ncbi:MAG: LysR family transcriptional regulator [Polyangiaceae bacterium]